MDKENKKILKDLIAEIADNGELARVTEYRIKNLEDGTIKIEKRISNNEDSISSIQRDLDRMRTILKIIKDIVFGFIALALLYVWGNISS